MRKNSVLILALLVLVTLPTWAVAGEPEPIKPITGEVAIVLIINENSGEVDRVYKFVKGYGILYTDVTKQTYPLTLPGEMLWYGAHKSPWHWCFVNGRYVRCP